MLVPKQNRRLIYSELFKEGVMVAKKDFNLPKHPSINVPNLQVIKLMQSLKSRNYVTEQFNWQYYYYYVTDEGIEYLREYLGLPAEIVPNTLARQAARPMTRPGAGPERGPRADRGDRDSYRRAPEGEKKAGGPGGDFNPAFRGGAGRGGVGRGRPE